MIFSLACDLVILEPSCTPNVSNPVFTLVSVFWVALLEMARPTDHPLHHLHIYATSCQIPCALPTFTRLDIHTLRLLVQFLYMPFVALSSLVTTRLSLDARRSLHVVSKRAEGHGSYAHRTHIVCSS